MAYIGELLFVVVFLDSDGLGMLDFPLRHSLFFCVCFEKQMVSMVNASLLSNRLT